MAAAAEMAPRPFRFLESELAPHSPGAQLLTRINGLHAAVLTGL